jgi:hypothetical protein
VAYHGECDYLGVYDAPFPVNIKAAAPLVDGKGEITRLGDSEKRKEKKKKKVPTGGIVKCWCLTGKPQVLSYR